MYPSGEKAGELKEIVRATPRGCRLVYWLVILDMVAVTGWVWYLAFRTGNNAGSLSGFPFPEFSRLLLGYHMLLLMTSLIGYAMQLVWNRWAMMGLFLPALILGTLSLNVAALQLYLVIRIFVD